VQTWQLNLENPPKASAGLTWHDEAPVLEVAISPDGLRIASASAAGTVKLWAPPGHEARTLLQGAPRINNVAFSPDGQRLAAAPQGQAVILDVGSGKALMRRPISDYARVGWSPDGRQIAVGSNGEVWDTTTGKIAQPLLDGFRSPAPRQLSGAGVAFSPDGKFLAIVSGGHSVTVWDAVTHRRLNTFEVGKSWATCVAFSPDGRRLAAGTAENSGGMRPGSLKIWDLGSGQLSPILESFRGSVHGVAFSPDGRLLAAAVGEPLNLGLQPGEVCLWDTRTGRRLGSLYHPSRVWNVAFSPDGKRLASVGGPSSPGRTNKGPGEVRIWDMNTGQEVCTLEGHELNVYGVAFSPDGRRLATASADGTLRIWDGTPLAETPDRDAMPPGD
jgi:WD40 repeat protein